VLLAAIVLARTGTPAAFHTALSSVSCLADIILLVPQEGSEAPDLEEVRGGMPCTPKFLQHNLTWSNSLSKALNLAMVNAEKDAGEGMGFKTGMDADTLFVCLINAICMSWQICKMYKGPDCEHPCQGAHYICFYGFMNVNHKVCITVTALK
jgi:hypothetical protein